MLRLVTLLLASGCVAFCFNIYRQYYLIKTNKTWDEAQTFCRLYYTDLATAENHDDQMRLVDLGETNGLVDKMWIGLRKTGGLNSWLWSEGESPTSNNFSEYANWAGLPNSTDHCGGMEDDGTWFSEDCETEYPFVCLDGYFENKSAVIFEVTEKMSWRRAQEFCRLYHTDLISVRSESDNQNLKQRLDENVSAWYRVWTGLFRDDWKWSDQSTSSFRNWSISALNAEGDCALFNPMWTDKSCSAKHPFFCYNAKKLKKRIVTLEMKSNSLLDLGDSVVGEAILTQIQKKFEGVKLEWRVQPDGKIFQKKKNLICSNKQDPDTPDHLCGNIKH